MLPLVLLQAALHFWIAVYAAGKSSLNAASGESGQQAIASAGQMLGLLYGLPLVMIGLLWALRWRELLRPAGIAVLAVTTVRGLTVMIAHLAALGTATTALGQRRLGFLADPIEWAFIIIGGVMCSRAWRLASDAGQMLPPDAADCAFAAQNSRARITRDHLRFRRWLGRMGGVFAL